MSTTETVLARIEADFPRHQQRWLDWLRIPSISAQPQHAADCRAAAEYARAQLAQIGFAASVRETAASRGCASHALPGAQATSRGKRSGKRWPRRST